jgi:thiol-disulfide isomerase/thioredoxin
MILLALLCTFAGGCSLFKKNSNSTQAPGGKGAAPPKFPNDPLLPTPPPAPTFPTGAQGPVKTPTTMLAGTVTDAYHRHVGGAYVRLVRVDEQETGSPLDVPSDSNGNFIIMGLKPGAKYKLIARTKNGERMMAGTVLTTAPDPKVLIPIHEDWVTAATPPLPSNAAAQVQEQPAKESPKAEGLNGAGAKAVIHEPNLPATLRVPAPSASPSIQTPVANPPKLPENTPTFAPGIAETPKDRLPMLTIPVKPIAPIPNDPPPIVPGDVKFDSGPTRLPSCVRLGNRVENIALRDSKGQAWEYKKQGLGKVVLLDFWGTHCLPCRETLPMLNRLQTMYGSKGLEVIGIAIERGVDERKEAEAVNRLCTSMKINYRQLMGRTPTFDGITKEFNIQGLPTLLLLSEQGDIIYYHLGRPDPAELERLIQRRLANRTF